MRTRTRTDRRSLADKDRRQTERIARVQIKHERYVLACTVGNQPPWQNSPNCECGERGLRTKHILISRESACAVKEK